MSLIPHFNSLYDNFFDDGDFFLSRQILPLGRLNNKYKTFDLDVEETNNNYKITADIPGIDKTDIDISFDNNMLTISFERKEETKETRDKYLHVERKYGKYSRSIYFPYNFKFEDINACYKDGVLNIIIPKNKNDSRKKIEVQ
jgi:HSP20 family protein